MSSTDYVRIIWIGLLIRDCHRSNIIENMFVVLSLVDELGDNCVKLLETHSLVGGSLVVDVGAVQHFQEVIISQVFVESLGNGLELFEFDNSIFILVVHSEHSLKTLLGLGLTNSRADDVEELFEGDGVVGISQGVDKGQNEGVSLIEAELLQNLVDFSRINGATSVLIEDFEGLLEILVVLTEESLLPGGRRGNLGGLGGLSLGCSTHKICNDNRLINKI